MTRITPGGPAHEAGLRMGDKIMQVCSETAFHSRSTRWHHEYTGESDMSCTHLLLINLTTAQSVLGLLTYWNYISIMIRDKIFSWILLYYYMALVLSFPITSSNFSRNIAVQAFGQSYHPTQAFMKCF